MVWNNKDVSVDFMLYRLVLFVQIIQKLMTVLGIIVLFHIRLSIHSYLRTTEIGTLALLAVQIET